MPVLRTNRMPVSASRSPTGGRPPLGLGVRFGSSGSTIAQSSSGRRGLAMVVISRVSFPGERDAIAMPNSRSTRSFVRRSYASSMLDSEEVIQDRLNQAGVVATQEALQQFDTDGSPIVIGSVKLTSEGRLPKEYQTPYGVATVARHVYQSSQGGKTYCPLDRDARIVTSSTPRFAKVIAHKYAEFGSGRVILDLEGNQGRKVARSFVRNVADAVA